MAKKRAKRGTAPKGVKAKRSKKRGRKRAASAGGAVTRGEFNSLKRTVEGHTVQLRHHGSFLRSLVNNVRKASGQAPMKDPLTKPAASVVPAGVVRRRRRK